MEKGWVCNGVGSCVIITFLLFFLQLRPALFFDVVLLAILFLFSFYSSHVTSACRSPDFFCGCIVAVFLCADGLTVTYLQHVLSQWWKHLV